MIGGSRVGDFGFKLEKLPPHYIYNPQFVIMPFFLIFGIQLDSYQIVFKERGPSMRGLFSFLQDL